MSPYRLAIVTAVVLGGCSDDDEPIPPCDFTEEVVSPDVEIPTGFPDQPVVVGQVTRAITLPMAGQLEWRAAHLRELVSATPDRGTTEFTSTLTVESSVVWSRVPGASGQHLLKCLPTLQFDVSIHFQTEDGVLDEKWDGRAASNVLTHGITDVEIDAISEGIPQTFELMRNPEAEPWDDETYYHRFIYGTCEQECGEAPAMTGEILYRGQFAPTRDGEIIDQRGFTVTLASWTGFASP